MGGARAAWLAAAAALLAACAAHRAPPATQERIVLPPAASEGTTTPSEVIATPPSVSMPREWKNHDGEDYDDLFDRMRAGFAFDEVQEPSIDQQLAWFQHNSEYLDRVFQRAQRYLYHVVTEVERRGMPLEFALLPVVESAYEPFAYSPSRASGLWQFIPATGTRFGLKQDWWYDGRRDVIESTRAALDYLQALHDQFGDWLLAIAAYNVGELAVQRAIDYNHSHGKPTDFWHLNLPAETRAYVPTLLALKRIMAEPERYGFDFAPIPNEPYFAVIDTGASQLQLTIAAQLAGTSYDELVALNPGYNRWATDPDGPHRMLVPIDNADAFEAALKTLAPEDRMHYEAHVVERHETLASIARHYDTSAAVLAKINDLPGGRVSVGESLKIPSINVQLPEKVLLAAARVDRPQADTGGRRQRRIVYRVRAGETLSSIAHRHGMPVSTLARLNNLSADDSLIKGQRLIIRASVRKYRDEGLTGGRRTLYTVRRGDTVYSISRQFQVSVAQLKSWNGLNKRHQIRAGQRLVMYVESSRQQG